MMSISQRLESQKAFFLHCCIFFSVLSPFVLQHQRSFRNCFHVLCIPGMGTIHTAICHPTPAAIHKEDSDHSDRFTASDGRRTTASFCFLSVRSSSPTRPFRWSLVGNHQTSSVNCHHIINRRLIASSISLCCRCVVRK